MRHDSATRDGGAQQSPQSASASLSRWPAHAQHERRPLGDRSAFLLEFLRHPWQVASVIPSSKALMRRLVRRAEVAQAATIVELGPGTGGTTRAILGAMRADARLLALELSPAFCERLAHTVRDARLLVQRGSAEHIEAFVAAHRLPPPDLVISGIPFSTMPPATADRIGAAIARVLAPGGRFVAYQARAQVVHTVSPYLGAPAGEWELLNLPPMRLFTWRRALTA
jgi:phospholipid N-methyltransferase